MVILNTVSRGDCQVGDTNVESNNVTETSKYTYILCTCKCNQILYCKDYTRSNKPFFIHTCLTLGAQAQ